LDDIRECIGCNICVSGDNTNVPMRCTQNPAVGEEWRRQWHPEFIRPLKKPESYLVIGGGPAGLEASRALVQRGAEVTLAESSDRWGGRVTLGRPHAHLYLQSHLSAADVLSFGISNIVVATGSHWRRDGRGRDHRQSMSFLNEQRVLTPDDIMKNGTSCLPSSGPVIVFDDERFYMAGVLAELIAKAGFETIYVSPSPVVSAWSDNTLEQVRIQRRLIELGVKLVLSHSLSDMDDVGVSVACCYSGKVSHLTGEAVVLVTSRSPEETLWSELQDKHSEWDNAGIKSVVRIGDCLAPGLIAAAVQSGHALAQSVAECSRSVMREDRAELTTDTSVKMQSGLDHD